MPKNRSAARSLLARLVLVGLVLRVAVPAGFMPTNLDDGWFLKFCPDGMSMSVMMALLGHDHHHHHANQQGDQNSEPYQQCDLGGGLADDSALPTGEQFTTNGLATLVQAQPLQDLVPTGTASAFQARAPPHSRHDQNT